MTEPSLAESCRQFIAQSMPADAAHDMAHIGRVHASARKLALSEEADWTIVEPAVWLHDCVAVAKDSADRPLASRMAAEAAVDFLRSINYAEEKLPPVYHAIEAHSYSANIAPRTLEAKVVQDADRLDALGAIGIARCLIVGGKLDRRLYHLEDPFCSDRAADDLAFTLDHFFTKLFKLPETMQTTAGREEALRRAARMRDYLSELGEEIGIPFRI